MFFLNSHTDWCLVLPYCCSAVWQQWEMEWFFMQLGRLFLSRSILLIFFSDSNSQINPSSKFSLFLLWLTGWSIFIWAGLRSVCRQSQTCSSWVLPLLTWLWGSLSCQYHPLTSSLTVDKVVGFILGIIYTFSIFQRLEVWTGSLPDLSFNRLYSIHRFNF